ncbi:MAG: hypothetical protein QGD94_03060 [Planctomycetia bacterium]|nr:hypothetical protein [Planctomycetia bacterium]
MLRKPLISVFVLAALLLIGFPAATAQPKKGAGNEDRLFAEGLKKRGQMTLLEAFLTQQGKTVGLEELVGLAGIYAQQATKATDGEHKEALFKKSESLYLNAIAKADKQIEAFADVTSVKRSAFYLNALKWRLELADMIFDKWTASERYQIEITDRQQGDRKRVAERLKGALETYRDVLKQISRWVSQMDRATKEDFDDKFDIPGFYREALALQRTARYHRGWLTYYYVYVHPPGMDKKVRKELLEQATTFVIQYATSPNKTRATKWYAMFLVGLCHREMGELDDAVRWLNDADNQNAPEELRVRARYEMARTRFKQKAHTEALKMAADIERAYAKKKGFEQNLYVSASILLQGQIFFRQGHEEKDPAKKAEYNQQAMAALNRLKSREPGWATIIRDTIRKSGSGTVDAKSSPNELWAETQAVYDEARVLKEAGKNTEAVTRFKKATHFCEIYLKKAKPQHANYPEALFSLASMHHFLKELGEGDDLDHLRRAAGYYLRVANEFPGYEYAFDSARSHASALQIVHSRTDAEADRKAYRDALRWLLKKYSSKEPGWWFELGVVLYNGNEFPQAAAAFKRVPENLKIAFEARRWAALSHREQLLRKTRTNGANDVIDRFADIAAKELIAFSAYAANASATAPNDRKSTMRYDAIDMTIMAAEILSMDSVARERKGHYKRADDILIECEKKFKPIPPRLKGQWLQVKFTALTKLGRTDEVIKMIGEVISNMPPDEAAALIRGLFDAIIRDVKLLLKGDKMDKARVKAEDAKRVGEKLTSLLDKKPGADSQALKEQIVIELAKVQVSAQRYKDALEMLKKLPGGDNAEEMRKAAIDVERSELMATCYMKVAEEMRNRAEQKAKTKQYYERALGIWQLLYRLYNARTNDPAAKDKAWDMRFNVYFCRIELGEANEVLKAVRDVMIIYGQRLPGRLRKRLMEVKSRAQAAGGKTE